MNLLFCVRKWHKKYSSDILILIEIFQCGTAKWGGAELRLCGPKKVGAARPLRLAVALSA